MERLLLREYNGLNSKTAISVENGTLILSGLIQHADVKNGNNRIYPKKILEREDKKYQQLIAENRAAGEANHPDKSEIDIKNISHLIKETWWKGDRLYAKLALTSNAIGRDLRDLIEKDGLTLGISTRGLGSISVKNGVHQVNEDYSLICYDLVFDPSVAGAYMLREGRYIKLSDDALTEGKLVESTVRSEDTPTKLHSLLDDILNIGR